LGGTADDGRLAALAARSVRHALLQAFNTEGTENHGAPRALPLVAACFGTKFNDDEFEAKSAQLYMRLPQSLLDATKKRTKARGGPYTRFVRQVLEEAVEEQSQGGRVR
jgi:hypothetical protein